MKTFDQLPDDARIWIYASDHLLSRDEETKISMRTAAFIDQWTAHEIPVDASFTILHQCFVVIGANEATSDISGCGIDKSFAFIKALGQEMHIDFLNRLQIEVQTPDAFIIGNKSKIIALLNDQRLRSTDITFDKSCIRKGDLTSKFSIPVSSAWFFPQPVSTSFAE